MAIRELGADTHNSVFQSVAITYGSGDLTLFFDLKILLKNPEQVSNIKSAGVSSSSTLPHSTLYPFVQHYAYLLQSQNLPGTYRSNPRSIPDDLPSPPGLLGRKQSRPFIRLLSSPSWGLVLHPDVRLWT